MALIFSVHFSLHFLKLLTEFPPGKEVHTYACRRWTFLSIFGGKFWAQNYTIEPPPSRQFISDLICVLICISGVKFAFGPYH